MTRFRTYVEGKHALFTRAEFKVERFTHDVMTPRAAVGVLESIYRKPQMRHVIHRIEVLKPIRHMRYVTNEVAVVGSAMPRDIKEVLSGNPPTLRANEKRVQRQNFILMDVAYVIESSITILDPGTQTPFQAQRKHESVFERRIIKGQRYKQPYLGCAEFFATVRPATPDDQPIKETRSLGLLPRNHQAQKGDPGLFAAQLIDGVLEVPAL